MGCPATDGRVYAVFDGVRPLSGLCLELLEGQKRSWVACAKGYASLGGVREREIECSGFSVRVQHNPGRITSTLAEVAGGAPSGRPCFLCPSSLPAEQKGVLYREDYLVLCNPMPVFPAHFTIARIAHEAQAISGRVPTLLKLSADFGPAFSVLYNGPECGASAPDHFHFQAVPSGLMPIEEELRKGRRDFKKRMGRVDVSLALSEGRQVVMLEGRDPSAVEAAFDGFIGALGAVLGTASEPMMNVICRLEGEAYDVLIFPRARHRPHAFYIEGEGRLAVSPAVVEMGGLIVTPVGGDFDRVDAPLVESVFREVSLDGATVERAVASMGGGL